MRRPGTSLITTSILLPYLFYHQLQKRTTVLHYGSAADTDPTSDIDVLIWFFSSFV
jgi:predicted nucleotidyltransferase